MLPGDGNSVVGSRAVFSYKIQTSTCHFVHKCMSTLCMLPGVTHSLGVNSVNTLC